MKLIKKNIILFVATGIGIITTFFLIPTQVVNAAINIPVYRLYNPNSGEHFYTTSYYEATCDYKVGWNIEGTGWYSPTAGTAVYRVFNPIVKGGDHYYTKSLYEGKELVKRGWKWDYEGKPIFYSGGSNSVYVSYNPYPQSGTHNYTTSSFEQNNLLKMGWKYGTVALNAIASGDSVGARTHVTRSNAPTRRVDINSFDIPDHTYRTLYPNNAWPMDDEASVPSGAPTVVYKGVVPCSDANTEDGGAKYSIITFGSGGTAGGTMQGLIGVGFQHVQNSNDKEFAGGKLSALLYNFKGGTLGNQGGQYYVTIPGGVNQSGTNSFEIDFYQSQQVCTYKINGYIVASLKTKIDFNLSYAVMTDYTAVSSRFSAIAFGQTYDWAGSIHNKNPYNFVPSR
ncbi:hypothetical protein QYH60_13220 (plasmid) [Lactococcus lactis subsp. lactis]|uniref:hypothetical protein n=1 Tax=Lactococcus lactis TaxID=1358 RepID=UPI0026495149|nr:hypothetical protein [Lactococcus lactis]WKB49909.1 hypothetical protein QYH60_13220 [Lactococcus lactis subsp. lactis]